MINKIPMGGVWHFHEDVLQLLEKVGFNTKNIEQIHYISPQTSMGYPIYVSLACPSSDIDRKKLKEEVINKLMLIEDVFGGGVYKSQLTTKEAAFYFG